jgi:hypothetical protein
LVATPVPAAGVYYFEVTLDAEQVISNYQINESLARGQARFVLDTNAETLTYDLWFDGIEGGWVFTVQLRAGAQRGQNSTSASIYKLPVESPMHGVWEYGNAINEAEFIAGRYYVEVKSAEYIDGEIRGQIDPDLDADGLSDYDEVTYYGTDPRDRDSDDDGLLDGEEVRGIGRLAHLRGVYTYMDALASRRRDPDEIMGEAPPAYPPSFDERTNFVTNPNAWDTDGDGLCDGLEIGNTEPIPGFTLPSNLLHPSSQIKGTEFVDANEDGLEDERGYRLVDLGPDEPPTDPTWLDTSNNGQTDGVADANLNGRIDDGESDPVIGFYPADGRRYSVQGGKLWLQDYDSPHGDGAYGRFLFHFGSLPEDSILLYMDGEGPIQIIPSTLTRGADGGAFVEFFLPGFDYDTINQTIMMRPLTSGPSLLQITEDTPAGTANATGVR